MIGHRVVHGGERFRQAVVIDESVLDGIRAAAALAPLHNPPNLLGIEACRAHWADVPQVAVFDTAFHQTLPQFAYRYAIPEGQGGGSESGAMGFMEPLLPRSDGRLQHTFNAKPMKSTFWCCTSAMARAPAPFGEVPAWTHPWE